MSVSDINNLGLYVRSSEDMPRLVYIFEKKTLPIVTRLPSWVSYLVTTIGPQITRETGHQWNKKNVAQNHSPDLWIVTPGRSFLRFTLNVEHKNEVTYTLSWKLVQTNHQNKSSRI